MPNILKVVLLFFISSAYGTEEMNNVSFKEFNTRGKLEHSIHAQNVTYENAEIIVQQPKIIQDHWELTADVAITTNEFKIISFYNNVKISDLNDDSLAIQTKSLDYLVDKKLFTTEEHVSFKKNEATMTGYGLRANLEQNQIKILNNVRTTFEVN